MKNNGKEKIDEVQSLSEELREKEIQIELQRTELFEKQSELEESRDRYADLYDFAPNGYLTLDTQGLIKEINFTGAQMLGVDKRNIVDLPFINFLVKDDFQKFLNTLRVAKQQNIPKTEEFRVSNKRIGTIYVHFVLTPLRDYKYKEVNFRISLTDLTERKKIEDRLKESEERFRTMAEYSPVMIWVSDMDYNIVYANKTKLEFLKRPFNEVKDHKWIDTIHPGDRERFLAILKRAYEAGESLSTELRVNCKENGDRDVLISAAPRKLPGGKMIGFTGTEVDITERLKVKRDLENSLREKEILLKEIHHRIKNNLQIISSLLNLQLNYLENEEIIEMLKSSQSRIRSMAMIHEKLYKTKELSNINFAEYTREFTTYLFNTYRSKIGNLRLNLDLSDIKLDINLSISLGLILNELITNALKHAFPNNEAGKVNISLKEEGEQVQLIISDNGKGLPDNFDIKNTNSLGLELVDSLVEQHKGSLEIKTNGHTEFRITLQKSSKPKTPAKAKYNA